MSYNTRRALSIVFVIHDSFIYCAWGWWAPCLMTHKTKQSNPSRSWAARRRTTTCCGTARRTTSSRRPCATCAWTCWARSRWPNATSRSSRPSRTRANANCSRRAPLHSAPFLLLLFYLCSVLQYSVLYSFTICTYAVHYLSFNCTSSVYGYLYLWAGVRVLYCYIDDEHSSPNHLDLPGDRIMIRIASSCGNVSLSAAYSLCIMIMYNIFPMVAYHLSVHWWFQWEISGPI